jgi:hypothetical protein
MLFEKMEAGLRAQELIMDTWNRRDPSRDYIVWPEDFDFSAMATELAHISILSSDGDTFRFRLAGTGVLAAFGGDVKGKSPADIDICRDCNTWSELANRALARLQPVSGRTRLDNGTIHYWLRLPMANDDGTVDTVLCHDRYLAPELGDDPETACKEANRRLRLDTHGLLAAA